MPLVIKKCLNCGNAMVCNERDEAICSDCTPKIQKSYERVRDFLREHSDAGYSMGELSKLLGVDLRELQALVEAGRLELAGSDQRERQIRQLFDSAYKGKQEAIEERSLRLKESGWHSGTGRKR